ncbi:MAG: YifB family Mg chelatase-like AAA ATPase [Candidatus Improbicoccus pseudotrichonymphae]|uniref:YifB family Mg chelatase-like AAA ATPase n=1 Tax=Candidatus Improbicoccus pseudotrichonymphae TaxID=3033792 RepID=A0AA48I0R6_9FIRM|nr:MAG: YifB family Mg chelatase-like AAA ATPase [Candidatus Improbicoccus pseudotrichonymphae]
MVSVTFSMGLLGLDYFLVNVEIDLSIGLPAFEIVGLPDISVKESRDRVRSAIKNSGFKFPVKRIVVNLAPSNTRKIGSVYDLSILIALLKADQQLTRPTDDCVFLGELSLNGNINPVPGILPMVLGAKEFGFKKVFVSSLNSSEAALVKDIEIYPVKNVRELIDFFDDKIEIEPKKFSEINFSFQKESNDFSQVKGQYEAKRALEIAAAGGHNVMMIGSPGSGKTMLAKRFRTIIPEMTFDEIIEVTKVYSVTGEIKEDSLPVLKRPFRAPHHTVSPAGLVGGGSIPKPGELSLAHNGILFLDELPEFARSVLEVLRQPMEDGFVTISRARSVLAYPCNVILIAAMNPCPCGYFGHPKRLCTCSKKDIDKYLSKISGPLLDRIDIHMDVSALDFENISSPGSGENSEEIKKRVSYARKIQTERYKNFSNVLNARANISEVKNYFCLNENTLKILKLAFDNIGFSARAYEKILKIARTIADLDNSEEIKEEHVSEAVQYRILDRKYWLKDF